MDATKIDLSKPAFGPDSQKVSDLEAPAEKPAESQPEEVKVAEPVKEVAESVEEPTEEQKVPYSRFKKFHDRALQAEQEAAEWRAKAESIKSEPKEEKEGEVPSYWKDLYGDSDASKKAWTLQNDANQRLIEEAREKALEAVRNERFEQSKREKENEKKIEQDLDALGESVGRELTEKEKETLFDIVDEYTRKDAKGDYVGSPLSFEKAWEIHQLKLQVKKAPRAESRDKVSALTNSATQGEPSIDEKNKDFNPLDWNAYRKRL